MNTYGVCVGGILKCVVLLMRLLNVGAYQLHKDWWSILCGTYNRATRCSIIDYIIDAG